MPDSNTNHHACGPSHSGSVSWTQEASVATVVIANPEHLNAITVAMWEQLKCCFDEIAGQRSIRVALVRGAGRAFAAGADIAEFEHYRSTRDQVRDFHDRLMAQALRAIAHCPVPVVAAIDGPCVGGGLEIAGACDLRIASERSRFGIPIHRLGFPLAPGEAASLVALAGPAVALELLLEGRILDAEEAYEKGLVTRVATEALFEDEVKACVERICSGAPSVARHHKWLVRTLAALDDAAGLSPAQRERCWDFVDTQDYARGVQAFQSKSVPKFEDN